MRKWSLCNAGPQGGELAEGLVGRVIVRWPIRKNFTLLRFQPALTVVCGLGWVGLARILESAHLPGCIFSKNQSRERRVEFMSISSLAMAK